MSLVLAMAPVVAVVVVSSVALDRLRCHNMAGLQLPVRQRLSPYALLTRL
jgi:hypothetical protein